MIRYLTNGDSIVLVCILLVLTKWFCTVTKMSGPRVVHIYPLTEKVIFMKPEISLPLLRNTNLICFFPIYIVTIFVKISQYYLLFYT